MVDKATAPGPNKTAIAITIPAGDSVSDAANLTSTAVETILSPPEWTPANISFLVSADNITFCDLWDQDGEVVKPMGRNRAIILDPALTSGAMYLKIRSGPSINPVIQTNDRVFTLVVQ